MLGRCEKLKNQEGRLASFSLWLPGQNAGAGRGAVLTAVGLVFPEHSILPNPVPFASLGIAIALACGGVSSFFSLAH